MTNLAELIPPNETARLAAVRRYEILDTPADGSFDTITALAARLLRVPIAIVSVVDADRIWFKSHHGLLDVEQLDRDPGLCASAILNDGPWVVTDARADARCLANPLVAGSFGLQFYAAMPLITADGFGLGTLCVLDTEPREISSEDLATLADLASLVMNELELRLASRRAINAESHLRRESEELADALQASLLPPRPPHVPGMEVAVRFMAGERGLKIGGDFFDVFRLASNDWGIIFGDACGKGTEAASLAALTRWTLRATAVHQFRPSEVITDLNAVLRADSDEDSHFCSVVFARLELDICGAWVTLASAGHPLPILVRASGTVQSRGFVDLPVGMFDAVYAVDDRVGLGPGDALVFYTDGVTEARNDAGELYGEDRLFAELAQCVGQSAEATASHIIRTAQAFAGREIADDVAVLVLGVPADAGDDPQGRVAAATGRAPDQLDLPDHPHDGLEP